MSTVAQTATLAWDYTMADIEAIAHTAIRRYPRSLIIDYDERYAIAWHGAVEGLYRAEEPPRGGHLVYCAVGALMEAVKEERRFQGHSRNEVRDAVGPAPREGADRNHRAGFATYWRPAAERGDGFSDQLVENMALPAVLGVLTPGQYQALAAYAAHDCDLEAAAASLGISYVACRNHVQRARARIKAAWFGDETPVDNRRAQADNCPSGHPWAIYGYTQPSGARRCRPCVARKNRKAHLKRKAKETQAAWDAAS